MDEDPRTPETETSQVGGEEKPPPFEPDPELVTYPERGRKDTPTKFRQALDELTKGESR